MATSSFDVDMDEPEVRDWTGAWPGVHTDIKWDDDPVSCVDGKMFCVLCEQGAGGSGRISFKADAHRFLELTGQPGLGPAPYLARAGWVQVLRPDALDAHDLHALVHRSYALVRARLSKRRQRELAD